ncbi:MAG: thrombospondin type 3 repeat-containing protein, partial [Myxococcales bacterium]|nr:thrombospondin type 3 repeat-containing protein [Myxococcales bacterium]
TPEGSPSTIADLACCCEGPCSKNGHPDVSATCTGEGDAVVLTCSPAQGDLDDDGTKDQCDPDRDGDGVDNGLDNCTDVANPDQSDVDADGIGDVCDDVDDKHITFTTAEIATFCADACATAENSCEGSPVTDCALTCAADTARDGWWLASYFCLESTCDAAACGLGESEPLAEDPRCPAACDALMPCELPEVSFPTRDACRALCTGATHGGSDATETIACAAALPDNGGACDFFPVIGCFPDYAICPAVCEPVSRPGCQPGGPLFASWPDEAACLADCEALAPRKTLELLGCQAARGCTDFASVCTDETLPAEPSATCGTICDAWLDRCGKNEFFIHREACLGMCDGVLTGVAWADADATVACIAGLDACPTDGDDIGAAFVGCALGTSPRCATDCQTIATCATELQLEAPSDCERSCTGLSLSHPERVDAVFGCVEAGAAVPDCNAVFSCLQPPLDEVVCAGACNSEAFCQDQSVDPACQPECQENLTRPPATAWSRRVCQAWGTCGTCDQLDPSAPPDACVAACAAAPDTCVVEAYGICEQVCQGMVAARQEDADLVAPCVVASLGPACDLYSALVCTPDPP